MVNSSMIFSRVPNKLSRQLISLLCFTFLSGCPDFSSHSEWYTVDCSDPAHMDGDLTYPVVGFPDRHEAEAVAANYIKNVVCSGKFPERPRFQVYFFNASDLDSKFQFINYNQGFFKQPASLLVKFRNGLMLLFCFNRMVINCNQVQKCECPYDFNWDPKVK